MWRYIFVDIFNWKKIAQNSVLRNTSWDSCPHVTLISPLVLISNEGSFLKKFLKNKIEPIEPKLDFSFTKIVFSNFTSIIFFIRHYEYGISFSQMAYTWEFFVNDNIILCYIFLEDFFFYLHILKWNILHTSIRILYFIFPC